MALLVGTSMTPLIIAHCQEFVWNSVDQVAWIHSGLDAIADTDLADVPLALTPKLVVSDEVDRIFGEVEVTMCVLHPGPSLLTKTTKWAWLRGVW